MGRMKRVDNEGALAWARSSSECARSRGQARLAMLMAAVQTEILFEIEPTKTARYAPLAGRVAGAR